MASSSDLVTLSSPVLSRSMLAGTTYRLPTIGFNLNGSTPAV
jgi:hypothetical protein